MKPMYASEPESTGAVLTSRFHQLSLGNRRRPPRPSLSSTSENAGGGAGGAGGVGAGGVGEGGVGAGGVGVDGEDGVGWGVVVADDGVVGISFLPSAQANAHARSVLTAR
jgi:hypothetical protein